MRLKNLLMPASVLAASLVLLTSKDARACSSPEGCWPGALLPSSGEVPASLPGFLWAPQNDPSQEVDPTQIQFVQVTAAGETPVAVTASAMGNSRLYLVTPTAPLLPDADYQLRAKQFCYGEAPVEWPTQAIVHTTSAAPLPTTLGTIKVYTAPEQTLDVATFDGSCSTTIVAGTKRVEIALSEEAAPWKNVLVYETLVDGETWRPSGSLIDILPLGGSWQGRGKDLVFTICGGDTGVDSGHLDEGMHTVKMRATIPGTSVALETEPLGFELACAESTPGELEDEHFEESSCSVAVPGGAAQGAAAAGALILGLAAAGARKRRTQSKA